MSSVRHRQLAPSHQAVQSLQCQILVLPDRPSPNRSQSCVRSIPQLLLQRDAKNAAQGYVVLVHSRFHSAHQQHSDSTAGARSAVRGVYRAALDIPARSNRRAQPADARDIRRTSPVGTVLLAVLRFAIPAISFILGIFTSARTALPSLKPECRASESGWWEVRLHSRPGVRLGSSSSWYGQCPDLQDRNGTNRLWTYCSRS